MSLRLVLWLLGGWFALAAVASLIIGRMISSCSSDDPEDAVEESSAAPTSVKQARRPKAAA